MMLFAKYHRAKKFRIFSNFVPLIITCICEGVIITRIHTSEKL